MSKSLRRNGQEKVRFLPFLFLFVIIYAVFLGFFYFKYVPLVKEFQFILIPVLCFLFAVSVFHPKKGILFFIFFFPLINNLPYFFNIFESTPHAPPALVLFLFFFLGWLIHMVFSHHSFSIHQIYKPLILISIIIFVSGVITIFRYANFFPFLSDSIYELVTNINGVTAGGAIMSIIFTSLNYLTGFLFFIIFVHMVQSIDFIKKVIWVLLISAFISIAFGMFQHFYNMNIGNTPERAFNNTINATFKDPNSFGVFLSVIIPLSIGSFFLFNKNSRVIPFCIVIFGLFVLPFTGSLSGFFGLFLSFFGFLFLGITAALGFKKSKPIKFKKWIISLALVVFIVSIIFTGLFLSKDVKSISKLKSRLSSLEGKGDISAFTSSRTSYFWDMAVEMTKDYPLTGIGVGSYVIELPNYAEMNNKQWRISDSAENYFFQVSSELGLIGLLLLIWIFYEIFKQGRRTFIKVKEDKRLYLIMAGLSLALLSFLANLLVHTYIGSYEVKYSFWLLVGMLFSLGSQPEKNVFFSRRFKMFGLGLIILFSGFHIWHSAHSLSLEARTEKLNIKQNFGFYKKEKTEDGRVFQWTDRYGGLTIRLTKPVLRIPLHTSHPDIRKNPVKIKIYLIKEFFRKKRQLDEIVLTNNSWKTYEYSLPEEMGQKVILFIKVSRTWNPQKASAAPDPRNLGVAVGEITFQDY